MSLRSILGTPGFAIPHALTQHPGDEHYAIAIGIIHNPDSDLCPADVNGANCSHRRSTTISTANPAPARRKSVE
jgi:hypothetical protein